VEVLVFFYRTFDDCVSLTLPRAFPVLGRQAACSRLGTPANASGRHGRFTLLSGCYVMRRRSTYPTPNGQAAGDRDRTHRLEGSSAVWHPTGPAAPASHDESRHLTPLQRQLEGSLVLSTTSLMPALCTSTSGPAAASDLSAFPTTADRPAHILISGCRCTCRTIPVCELGPESLEHLLQPRKGPVGRFGSTYAAVFARDDSCERAQLSGRVRTKARRAAWRPVTATQNRIRGSLALSSRAKTARTCPNLPTAPTAGGDAPGFRSFSQTGSFCRVAATPEINGRWRSAVSRKR